MILKEVEFLKTIKKQNPEYDLVGAMDDDDAARAREFAPNMQYRRIDSNHVIHSHIPSFAHECGQGVHDGARLNYDRELP